MNQILGRINPAQHYWLADDDRVYSGPLQQIVTTADPGYAEFLTLGAPMRWPVDEAGAQTDAILAETLAPHGLAISPAGALMNYAAQLRYAREVEGIDFNGNTVDTDRESQARITRALAYAQVNDDAIVNVKTRDGFIELDRQGIADLAKAVGEHVEGLWSTEAAIARKIASGQIKTKDQIDAEF